MAVLTGLTLFAFGYRMAGQSSDATLPGIEFARWLEMWIWIPATLLPLTFLLLLFPDGRLPAARWRPIGWAAGAVGSMAALVIRFRRSRGIERKQLKWLAYAGVLAILGNIAISYMTLISSSTARWSTARSRPARWESTCFS